MLYKVLAESLSDHPARCQRCRRSVADDQVIQTCVAMGWPDDSFPANAVVSRRKPVSEAARFVGFAD